MELEGIVHNGVIVLDDAPPFPEGMRVRITQAPPEKATTFGERFARFKGPHWVSPWTLLRDPLFDVVGYLPAVYQSGFDLFATRSDKAWSLTDCISFGVMNEQGLSDALTADHHFEQAGFRAIFKS